MQVRKYLYWPAAVLLVAGTAMAQTSQSATRLKRADDHFLTAAAQGGLAEVEMGRLATQHASSDSVKQFGQRMIDDHSKANDELKGIASQKGLTMPTEVDAKSKATMERLSKLSGAAFDRAYMQDMVRDHQADIAEFKQESANGSEQDLKSFATKTLPTLQEHLQMAQKTQAGLK